MRRPWLLQRQNGGHFLCRHTVLTCARCTKSWFYESSVNIFPRFKAALQVKKITRLLQRPKVLYRFSKNTPSTSILSQMNPVYSFPTHSSKINFNIILPSALRSSESSLLLSLSHQNLVLISHIPNARTLYSPPTSCSLI
jgi:hypothetical protein